MSNTRFQIKNILERLMTSKNRSLSKTCVNLRGIEQKFSLSFYIIPFANSCNTPKSY